MKLLITTQVYENYAWREDGSLATGDDAYWKAKGGDEYVIRGVDPLTVAPGLLVEQVCGRIEHDSDAYREHILDWQLVADDYLTQYEQDQLEYDGRIDYPATELEIA